MERLNVGKERLVVPTDFTSPTVQRNVQEDLVPPSHFASSVQSAGAQRGFPTSWINPGVTSIPSGDPSPANPWLTITQAQQEILELRKENQRIMMLHENSIRGKIVDHPSELRPRSVERSEQWCRRDSKWHLEEEKQKAEAERLKGQVEALKESEGRNREEIRDRDSILNRRNLELETMHEELSKAKAELSQIRDRLVHSSAQEEKMSSELERLKSKTSEEVSRLRRDADRREAETQALVLRAEMGKSQAEEEAKQKTLQLSEHLEEMQRKHEEELQRLNASHTAELASARKTNDELQDRFQSMTSEVLQLKNTLMEVSTERDGLKEHLSQMGQAFETQSATLQSLRNYIGQFSPEKQEKEKLNEAVERLNKEKAALQMTAELLTIRLNSVNEILALQEEKMVMKNSIDSHSMKNGREGIQVIKLWREKVFKLCVQLRSKDIELRREQEELLSKIGSLEQQLQQEQHRATVLQHTLDDRIAELDLERVEKETLKQDMAHAHKENSHLQSQCKNCETESKLLTEAVHRFRLAFEGKMAEVDAAQTRLNTFTQRLMFAKRRVETIQGLIMRRVALQKIQKASKQSEQTADSLTSLQTQLSLVCEERDKLAQELRRTPELVEKALADLKEKYESKWRRQQQELEQSWAEVRQAAAEKDKAEHSLQHIQAQLEESKVNLEKLRSELLIQQEHSEQVLQQRVSETEDRCDEKLREMEVQVSTARREHTKAVMTLRKFERDAARKQDGMRETPTFGVSHTKRRVQNTQLRKVDKDKNLPPVTAAERELARVYTGVHDAETSQKFAAHREKQKPPERSSSVQAGVQLPADERLLSVLEELHTLSVAVVHSSEDSAEEEEVEGENNSTGPSIGSLHH
ncbi:coiled-coil alpha-helical rod protein 1 [Solea senegalensis]|uniref:Coiled-coil alpha-helical rod protein 1 n=1 Tax=Solea senegalensis TaxID=28829 RepID=A0AAV6SH63_SOLSE|nr:coiled-coil alpha-helical rod protein 1 [Solea senegalensis]KAG7516663.1 coiled-coil alpha-helical rod protein 1 [Solea senegalensis]